MPGTVMLATFCRDWAGGDIRELREAAGTLGSLAAGLSEIEAVSAL